LQEQNKLCLQIINDEYEKLLHLLILLKCLQKNDIKQSKNWLVELSWQKPIWEIQDYGQLSTLSQEKSKAIFEITEKEAWMIWTIDNLKKSKEEFQIIYDELLDRLNKW